MADNIVLIMGGLIAILVIFVIISNLIEGVSGNTMVEIKTLEYMKTLDPILWASEEEWEIFYCNLCEYGKAGNINVGNVTCPDYPNSKCGCEISMKLKFEAVIKNMPQNANCSVKVNGIDVQTISGINEGKNEFDILLGLSSGARIDAVNEIEVCCNSVCASKTLGMICNFNNNLY